MKFDTPELSEALESLSTGNPSVAAIEVLKSLAKAGNPKAQCNLASCYQNAMGVEYNAQEAVRLYEIVARQNIQEEYLSAIACNNVAGIYYCGAVGVKQDREKAAEYRAQCRSLGFPMAL